MGDDFGDWHETAIKIVLAIAISVVLILFGRHLADNVENSAPQETAEGVVQ